MGLNGNMKKPKIRSIFDWLKEITYLKTPPEEFSQEDWDKHWNTYMINKFLSMEPKYIELVNYGQDIMPQHKIEVYRFYKNLIPKEKVWLKYKKSNLKKYNSELISNLSKHFECSFKEAQEYLDLLPKSEVNTILSNQGMEDKEIKSLWKTKNH